jgi:hypothetical protein
MAGLPARYLPHAALFKADISCAYGRDIPCATNRYITVWYWNRSWGGLEDSSLRALVEKELEHLQLGVQIAKLRTEGKLKRKGEETAGERLRLAGSTPEINTLGICLVADGGSLVAE